MLARLPPGGLFVAAPDVVADHAATVRCWHQWAEVIRSAGQRPAFVLQDGCDFIPSDADALFVGGTTAFKMGREVAAIIRSAKARNPDCWIHMGRVNTRSRVLYAGDLGCDSVDGTGTSMYPDEKIPRMLRWARIASESTQMTLVD